MENLDITSSSVWAFGSLFGNSHPLFVLQSRVLIHTWIIILLLISFFIIARIILMYDRGFGRYLVLNCVSFFIDLCTQSIGFFSHKHISFIAALFVFIFSCNTFAIIPGLEEPTANLNTTLALGVLSFLYIQYEAIKSAGLLAYIMSYFQPFFLLLPINIIGKLSTVVSMSFRLFGNIFGGSLITHIYTAAISKHWFIQIVTLTLGLNLMITGFFTLFEGALQAFVFTMLTLTYLTLAIKGEEGH